MVVDENVIVNLNEVNNLTWRLFKILQSMGATNPEIIEIDEAINDVIARLERESVAEQ